MSYMLLILENAEEKRRRPAEARIDAYERMMRFRDELQARGVYLASSALGSDAEGVRVESRNGRRSLLDGPFAEAKEIVGGFFLIDVATREQAVEIAQECPAIEWATVEVRRAGRPCHEA